MTRIFVFGSNLRGRHGAGAAHHAATHHNAEEGVGVGPTGTAYAIPTKDFFIQTLPLASIKPHVDAFIYYARQNSHLRFQVTAIGTGLAGYKHTDIAPMFRDAPSNCDLPDEWKDIIGELK